jgi:hypothetical protein
MWIAAADDYYPEAQPGGHYPEANGCFDGAGRMLWQQRKVQH